VPVNQSQFATLEIELNLQPEENAKATIAVAFFMSPKSNGWTNLTITPLERRI
jgi:hypothetical protein